MAKNLSALKIRFQIAAEENLHKVWLDYFKKLDDVNKKSTIWSNQDYTSNVIYSRVNPFFPQVSQLCGKSLGYFQNCQNEVCSS